MELPFKSVYAKPTRNNSMAAQATASLSTQIRTQLTRVAQLQLESMNDADAILETTIVSYDKSEIASSSLDTGVGQAFRIRMTVSIDLYDRVSKTYYLRDKKVDASISVYDNTVSGGVLEQEYQNMPQLCRELATNIVNEITAIW